MVTGDLLRSRKLGRSAIACGIVASLAACSGLLGLTDPALDNALGGGDGSANSDANLGDAPINGDGSTTRDGATTCTADLTKDKNNCGACGHGCLGGECAASECQPVLVVGDAANLAPYDIALNTTDGFLYFTNIGAGSSINSVARVAKSAVNATSADVFINTATTGSGSYPYEIATVGTSVFFATHNDFQQGMVMECSIGTTSVTCPTPGQTVSNADSYAVAVGGTSDLAFADEFNPSDGGDTRYSIRKGLVSDLVGATPILLDHGSYINWIKIDGSTVYFAAPEGVYSCPFTGCGNNPKHLTPTSPEAEEIAVANGQVYFTSSSGAVYSVPESGGTIVPITTNVIKPLGIIADATHVYFADNGNEQSSTVVGKVGRCPIAGCGTSSEYDVSTGLAAGGYPRCLTQDDTAVYWGNANGEIWKVAKPPTP